MYRFLKIPILTKSRKWNRRLFGVYQKRKFVSEDSFVFLCLSLAVDAVQILKI